MSQTYFQLLSLYGTTDSRWDFVFFLPCLCCLSATSGALKKKYGTCCIIKAQAVFYIVCFFILLLIISSTSLILLHKINCRADLPGQHVHSFLCSFCLLVLRTVQQTLDLQALLKENNKNKNQNSYESRVSSQWKMRGATNTQEWNNHFLATCECTKLPKITTVAVQGLDNTCAVYSKCQVSKGNLLDLL